MIKALNDFYEYFVPHEEDKICGEELQARHGEFPVLPPSDTVGFSSYIEICKDRREFVERVGHRESGVQTAHTWNRIVKDWKAEESHRSGSPDSIKLEIPAIPLTQVTFFEPLTQSEALLLVVVTPPSLIFSLLAFANVKVTFQE